MFYFLLGGLWIYLLLINKNTSFEQGPGFIPSTARIQKRQPNNLKEKINIGLLKWHLKNGSEIFLKAMDL
jgi:hypothetical protein